MLRVGAEGAEWKRHVAAFQLARHDVQRAEQESSAHLSASKRDDQHGGALEPVGHCMRTLGSWRAEFAPLERERERDSLPLDARRLLGGQNVIS